MNDADGWRLNVLSLCSGDVKKIGRIDDRFGLLGPFYWHPDSTSVAFSGFRLSDDNARTYGTYEYRLGASDVQTLSAPLAGFFDQSVRFWISPERH